MNRNTQMTRFVKAGEAGIAAILKCNRNILLQVKIWLWVCLAALGVFQVEKGWAITWTIKYNDSGFDPAAAAIVNSVTRYLDEVLQKYQEGICEINFDPSDRRSDPDEPLFESETAYGDPAPAGGFDPGNAFYAITNAFPAGRDSKGPHIIIKVNWKRGDFNKTLHTPKSGEYDLFSVILAAIVRGMGIVSVSDQFGKSTVKDGVFSRFDDWLESGLESNRWNEAFFYNNTADIWAPTTPGAQLVGTINDFSGNPDPSEGPARKVAFSVISNCTSSCNSIVKSLLNGVPIVSRWRPKIRMGFWDPAWLYLDPPACQTPIPELARDDGPTEPAVMAPMPWWYTSDPVNIGAAPLDIWKGRMRRCLAKFEIAVLQDLGYADAQQAAVCPEDPNPLPSLTPTPTLPALCHWITPFPADATQPIYLDNINGPSSTQVHCWCWEGTDDGNKNLEIPEKAVVDVASGTIFRFWPGTSLTVRGSLLVRGEGNTPTPLGSPQGSSSPTFQPTKTPLVTSSPSPQPYQTVNGTSLPTQVPSAHPTFTHCPYGNPVIFSTNDDLTAGGACYYPTPGSETPYSQPGPGNWAGINFLMDGGRQSSLSFAEIRYAGGLILGTSIPQDVPNQVIAAVHIANGPLVNIKHVVFRENLGAAVGLDVNLLDQVPFGYSENAQEIILYNTVSSADMFNAIQLFDPQDSDETLRLSPRYASQFTFGPRFGYAWVDTNGVLAKFPIPLPYYFPKGVRIQAGVTLTVRPETVLAFSPNGTLTNDGGVVNIAGEPDKPVILTSAFRPLPELALGAPEILTAVEQRPPQPGDWGGVNLIGSDTSRLSNCEISYGGQRGDTNGAIMIVDGAPVLDHVTLRNNLGCSLLLDYNEDQLDLPYGLWDIEQLHGDYILLDNDISETRSGVFNAVELVDYNHPSNPTIAITRPQFAFYPRYVHVKSANVIEQAPWPYYLSREISINSGITTTVEEGTVFCGGPGVSLTVKGVLDAVGGVAGQVVFAPIRFTSPYDKVETVGTHQFVPIAGGGDPLPGDWTGLSFMGNQNGPPSYLRYCEIAYAGGYPGHVSDPRVPKNVNTALRINAPLVMDHVTFRNNLGVTVIQNFLLDDNQIQYGTQDGLDLLIDNNPQLAGVYNGIQFLDFNNTGGPFIVPMNFTLRPKRINIHRYTATGDFWDWGPWAYFMDRDIIIPRNHLLTIDPGTDRWRLATPIPNQQVHQDQMVMAFAPFNLGPGPETNDVSKPEIFVEGSLAADASTNAERPIKFTSARSIAEQGAIGSPHPTSTPTLSKTPTIPPAESATAPPTYTHTPTGPLATPTWTPIRPTSTPTLTTVIKITPSFGPTETGFTVNREVELEDLPELTKLLSEQGSEQGAASQGLPLPEHLAQDVPVKQQLQNVGARPQMAPGAGDWSGIYILNNADDQRTRFVNAVVEHAITGVSIKQASPSFTSTTFYNNLISGVKITDNAFGSFVGCKFVGNGDAGLELRRGVRTYLVDNTFSSNGRVGIYAREFSAPVLRGNSVTYQELGVLIDTGAAPIMGKVDPSNNLPEFEGLNFFEGNRWNIFNDTNNTIYAQNCSWGTDATSTIDATIYDDEECKAQFPPGSQLPECGPVIFLPLRGYPTPTASLTQTPTKTYTPRHTPTRTVTGTPPSPLPSIGGTPAISPTATPSGTPLHGELHQSITLEGLVHVTASVEVPRGLTVIIKPGTIIVFDGEYGTEPVFYFHPGADLQAQGTPADPIVFMAAHHTVSDGTSYCFWGGVVIAGAEYDFDATQSSIRHAVFRRAQRGVSVTNSRPLIEYCKFIDCATGVYVHGTGDQDTRPRIRNNWFEGHENGVYIDLHESPITSILSFDLGRVDQQVNDPGLNLFLDPINASSDRIHEITQQHDVVIGEVETPPLHIDGNLFVDTAVKPLRLVRTELTLWDQGRVSIEPRADGFVKKADVLLGPGRIINAAVELPAYPGPYRNVITNPEYWAGDIVIADQDIIVQSTVTIAPRTTIRIFPNDNSMPRIIVDYGHGGCLIALGERLAPITICSALPVSAGGVDTGVFLATATRRDWGGLMFDGTRDNQDLPGLLRWTNIRNSDIGVACLGCAPVLEHVRIEDVGDIGVFCSSQFASALGEPFNYVVPVLFRANLKKYGIPALDRLQLLEPETRWDLPEGNAHLIDCNILGGGFTYYGLYSDDCQPIIESSALGVDLDHNSYPPSAFQRGAVFSRGVRVPRLGIGPTTNNMFINTYNPNQFRFEVESNSPSDMDAMGNYWAVTYPAFVEDRVYDKTKNASLGKVFIDPPLAAPPKLRTMLGDLNKDLYVDNIDFIIFNESVRYGLNSAEFHGFNQLADFNGDYVIDGVDLILFMQIYNSGAGDHYQFPTPAPTWTPTPTIRTMTPTPNTKTPTPTLTRTPPAPYKVGP